MSSKMEEANMSSTAPPLYEEAVGKPPHPTATSMPMPMHDQPMQYNQPQPQPQPQPYQPPQPQPYQPPPPQGGPYAQQLHYPPVAGPQVLPTVILTNPPRVILGPHSQRMLCPSCHNEINTTIVSEASLVTHLAAFGLFFIGCLLCSCIPYFIDSLKNASHYCPKCNVFIGSYNRHSF